VEDKNRFF
jgi:hypothetical protein